MDTLIDQDDATTAFKWLKLPVCLYHVCVLHSACGDETAAVEIEFQYLMYIIWCKMCVNLRGYWISHRQLSSTLLKTDLRKAFGVVKETLHLQHYILTLHLQITESDLNPQSVIADHIYILFRHIIWNVVYHCIGKCMAKTNSWIGSEVVSYTNRNPTQPYLSKFPSNATIKKQKPLRWALHHLRDSRTHLKLYNYVI